MDTMNQLTASKATIAQKLKEIIIEVVGEDFLTTEEINIGDSFTEDLEMESIEIVEFADLVKSEYGKKADLTAWLSDMDLDTIINLKLSQVVDFLDQEISA